jgi:hypothetical protein
MVTKIVYDGVMIENITSAPFIRAVEISPPGLSGFQTQSVSVEAAV